MILKTIIFELIILKLITLKTIIYKLKIHKLMIHKLITLKTIIFKLMILDLMTLKPKIVNLMMITNGRKRDYLSSFTMNIMNVSLNICYMTDIEPTETDGIIHHLCYGSNIVKVNPYLKNCFTMGIKPIEILMVIRR